MHLERDRDLLAQFIIFSYLICRISSSMGRYSSSESSSDSDPSDSDCTMEWNMECTDSVGLTKLRMSLWTMLFTRNLLPPGRNKCINKNSCHDISDVIFIYFTDFSV